MMREKTWIAALLVTLLLGSGCRRVCDCVTVDSAQDTAVDSTQDMAVDPAPEDVSVDPAVEDAGPELPPGGVEARGIWVTRWDFASAADIATIMDRARQAGFNQVYFQVRGTADAYYDSDLEPWAASLGGLGVNPGWDPLAVAVAEAHERDLQLHTWLNTFPVWSGSSPPGDSTPAHIYNAHPEWICADESGTPMAPGSGYVFGSPGNPDLRTHIGLVAADIVSKYDVDGVHLDYIRYPGLSYCHDAVSEARFAEASTADPGLTWETWQREQVTATVEGVRAAMDGVDPETDLSTAVWGIHENVWGWSSVSQGYVEYFQDPRAWTDHVDGIAPMIYWSIKEPYATRLDFRAILDDHIENMGDTPVYAGIEGNYESFDEIAAQIQYARETGAGGYVIFAYSYLVDHDYFDDLAAGPNAQEALAP